MAAARTRTDRPYDVVLCGATGFTGGLTAERLAADGPEDLRWAISGRDGAKLEAVREWLAGLGKAGSGVEALRCDVEDAASVRALAEQTAVVATTVGPFLEYGEPLVAACADAGTDYADIAGEPEFVDRMWLAHHERAERTGARVVHACGFDSVPHDLGVYFTVQQLPQDVPITVSGYVRVGASPSAGTYHSAIGAFARVRQASEVAAKRRKLETRPAGRRVRGLPRRPTRAPAGRGWALPLPTIDPVVVRRSARAVDRYGPDFRYGHFAVVRRLRTAVVVPAALGGMVALAQIPPGRDLLLRRRQAGDDPSAARRARSWFKVRFEGAGGDRRVSTEVSGGDPGYDETARMLAQSALCLAFDDLPDTAGQVTTVQAMGDALLRRLRDDGMRFEVIESAGLPDE
ncbi:MAG TPA: saccharopine dehydrogenase NADP-binding domain-containing protein [Nocardioidaceae bacterium]|jgi:saccharopine dehydrogenase (NAD+, L-glutamate forming)